MEGFIAREWDFYRRRSGARIPQREFGFYCMDRWIREGHVSGYEDVARICGFDEPAAVMLRGLGGCEAALCPYFEEKVLEDRGAHELAQDFVGRKVLYFKGRRNGFMPEYVDHPVKDLRSLEEQIAWRMDPETPARWAQFDGDMQEAQAARAAGKMVRQYIVGGYMYLRSLIGPQNLLFAFYDDPELIHACMRLWLDLGDRWLERTQAQVELDELLFDEDICYNHGTLISPEMIRTFLFPYYQQLVSNARARQRHSGRHLFVHLATDGDFRSVLPLYMEAIGVDRVSPLEVAAGCDPVEIGRKWPELVLSGGFDKRILAKGRDAIAREVERILPVMVERGGYCPTCDHGVPEEVDFEDYVYFRELLRAY